MQDSPTPGANSVAGLVLDRLYAYTGERLYRDLGGNLECFVNRVPQYGLFAAHVSASQQSFTPAISLQVVILAPRTDPVEMQLESAANEVYRFGKAVLRAYARNSRGWLGASAPRCAKRCRISTRLKRRRWSASSLDLLDPPTSRSRKLRALLVEVAASPAPHNSRQRANVAARHSE